MDKIKKIYQHNGTGWGDAIPIGTDAKYVDVTDEGSSVPLNNLIKDMTQEELQEFLGKLPSGIPADYVKKSGDTMTGPLKINGHDNTEASISTTNDGSNLDIGWDYSNYEGAVLGLRSINFPTDTDKGAFSLYANRDGSRSILTGKPNGDLTWDDKYVFVTNEKWTDDKETNNTTDTWIPVWKGDVLQHRVIPTNANSSCTKYGSVWTSGGISLYRRGNAVLVNGDPTLSATTARTQFATIPEGFRPCGTVYVPINSTTDYLIFSTNGSVQVNARSAGTMWFSGSWVVN